MDTVVLVETIGPDKANAILSRMPYEHQRNIARRSVEFLAEEMRRGAFKQDTPIELSSANGSNSWMLTDGQHRLSAVVASGKEQRFVVVRRRLQSDDEIAMDYTRTDKGRIRSVFDDYKVLSIDTELGLTQTQVNKFGAAVNMIINGFSSPRGKIHTDDRLRLMREYDTAYADFLEIAVNCSGGMRKAIERSATLAVALVTHRYSVKSYGKRVEEFWTGAIWDDGLRIGDPRKTANRHLLETSMAGGGANSQYTVSAAYSARFLATCFNSFVAGESRRMVKSSSMPTSKPIIILGSPFDGKEA